MDPHRKGKGKLNIRPNTALDAPAWLNMAMFLVVGSAETR
jgi:hypothetical protein